MLDDYDPSSIKKSDLTELTCENTETVLSVYWKNDMLGAAFFNSELSEIQILHDVIDNNFDFKILNYLFIQFRPAYIVVSNSQDQTFLKQVKQLAYKCKMNMYTSSTNADDDNELDEKVNILPKKCFKFKTCEQLILSISLASAPENEESRKRYVRSLVDFTQELAVCALGALLHFLDSPLIKFNLPTNFIILSLRILHLDDVVWLCMSTYESLQIFSTREYSSVNNWTKKSNKKEPSIFSLLNRCSSALGSIYLKNILTQPTKSINVLEYRHEVIEFCLNPCNESTILSLVNCIKHCRCVLLTMVKVNGGNASMYQWKLLYQTLINAVTIGEICEKYAEQIKFFSKIKNALKNSLYTMANTMSSIIDFEQSTIHKRFIVNSGFMPELDEKKTKLENISQLLDTMTFQELIQLPSYIQECSICKMHDFGFLLCIPIWKSSKEMSEHDYKIKNLEFKFQFSDNVYYKTSRCYELDQLFAEIESSIIQEEIQVMIKLCKVITQNWIGDLHAISKLIAELDCLIGLADVAQDLKLTKPKILPKELCIINIVNGRHILQEKYVDKFIPNSYHSSKTSQKINIITGFNSSGKSIYLKQVALISYLCHIGCYVPAEYTEISILDNIHTRIQTTESVSSSMSAFMIDLKQMSVALNESTCASLVILDEFGKGTSDTNGLALLLACMSNFVLRPTDLLPHVILSTHFHSLSNFLQQIVDKDILHRNIKYSNMSHVIENSKIVCLYKIVDKIEDQNMSMAHNIAALNDLPACIVERASQVLRLIENGEYVTPMVENLRYKLFNRYY